MLLILMAGAVYTHVVLQDGHFIAPAVLGEAPQRRIALACSLPFAVRLGLSSNSLT